MSLTFLKKKIIEVAPNASKVVAKSLQKRGYLPSTDRYVKNWQADVKEALFPKVYWSLETHGVSQGMLMEFLSCREKARLGYIEGWTSLDTSNAITFGSLFHSCLEEIYKHVKAGKEVVNSVYLENVAKFVLQEYKDEIEKSKLWTPEDEKNHLLNTGYLLIMLPAYVKNYIEKDKKQKWLIVEDEFQNDFYKFDTDPRTQPNKDMHVMLKGRYDQVYENKHGEVWIKEVKTKGRIDPSIQDRLSFDFQAMFYIFNYWLEFKVMPTGFVYDIIQRPALRQGKNENLQHFMGRIKGDVDETYFKRIRMRVTREELDKWIAADFIPILHDFLMWAKGGTPTYRNPASCETRYGNCKYLRICGLRDFGGLYQKQHTLLEEKVI